MAARAVVTAAADTLRTEVGLGERTVVVDEPERLGGTDCAPTPMELLVASLASCIAITLRMYVRRKGWELGEVGVEVCLDRDDRPHCATVTLRLPGDLDPERAERLR